MTAAPLAGAIGTPGDVRPYGDMAAAYWAAGWRGILPLPAREKTPPPGGYTGRTGVEPSYADVYAWTEERGAGNIALRLPLGVLGVDVDAYLDKPGALTLAALEAQVGAPIPPTVSVTARGPEQPSRIRLYRADLPDGRVWRDELEGLDAIHRGHRYMVAPPSVHPNGLRYVAYAPDTVTPLDRAIRLDELAALPAEWVEALSKPGDVLEPGSATTEHAQAVFDALPVASAERPMCERLREAAGRYLAHVAAGREKQDGLHRSGDVLALVAFAFEGHHGARGALAQHAHAFIEARSVGRAEGNDVARNEWWRMFTSAVGTVEAEHGAPKPRCDCEPDTSWAEGLEVPADFAGAGSGSGAPDAAWTPPVPLTAEELEAAQAAALEAQVEAEAQRLRVRKEAARRVALEEAEAVADDDAVSKLLAECLTSAQLDDVPELTPLVDGWLWLDALFRIVGASNSYKSFLGVDIACHVATGRQWFGYDVRKGTALYVVAEGAAGLRRRVRAWESTHNLGVPVDGLRVLPRPVQIGGDEWTTFLAACAVLEPSLILFDTQARVTVGRGENDNSEMGVVVEMAERLRTATGAAVGLVHHTGYDKEHGRGATALYAAMQTELHVDRPGDLQVSVKATKQKDHPQLGPCRFKMQPVGDSLVMVNVDGEDAEPATGQRSKVLAAVVECAGTGITHTDLTREPYNLPKSTASRALTGLEKEGLVVKRGASWYPCGGAVGSVPVPRVEPEVELATGTDGT